VRRWPRRRARTRRRRTNPYRALVVALLVGGALFAVREGLLPHRWTPLPLLDLATPDPWFLDWRLSALRVDADACGKVLRAPWIEAAQVADAPITDGCGWMNGVRLNAAGGARLSVDRITCEVAAGLALWLAHDVQPRAQEIFGAKVASVQHLGSYACRNIKGDAHGTGMRSEHARANALDIAGFTLTTGRQISVARHWAGGGPETQFLRAVHAGACRVFRVALGPDYNAAHRDHFHYDRGLFTSCR
jgi:hypothetical protein